MVLENNSEVAVMVSLDLATVAEDFEKELQETMNKEIPELDSSRIFLNAIHTHNAPGMVTWRDWWEPDNEAVRAEDYRQFLMERLVRLIAQAWQSRSPAGIASSFSSARIGHSRCAMYEDGTSEMYGDTGREDFVGMEGGEDSGVELLFTFTGDTPSGCVVNLACPSQVLEAGYRISSDFMGALGEKLKARFGAGFATLSQISAAGCQAPRDLSRNYKSDEPDFWHEDGVETAAERLSKAVIEGFEKIEDNIRYDGVELRHKVKRLKLPRRRASQKEYEEAEKVVAELEAIKPSRGAYADFLSDIRRNEAVSGRPGPYDSKLHNFVLIQNAKAVLKRHADQEEKPGYEFELHVVRLGDIAFVSNPFELYLAYGQQLKARSCAAQTIVIQLATDYGGYLPTASAEQRGAYGSLIINGQVGSAGGKMLIDETLDAIAELFK